MISRVLKTAVFPFVLAGQSTFYHELDKSLTAQELHTKFNLHKQEFLTKYTEGSLSAIAEYGEKLVTISNTMISEAYKSTNSHLLRMKTLIEQCTSNQAFFEVVLPQSEDSVEDVFNQKYTSDDGMELFKHLKKDAEQHTHDLTEFNHGIIALSEIIKTTFSGKQAPNQGSSAFLQLHISESANDMHATQTDVDFDMVHFHMLETAYKHLKVTGTEVAVFKDKLQARLAAQLEALRKTDGGGQDLMHLAERSLAHASTVNGALGGSSALKPLSVELKEILTKLQRLVNKQDTDEKAKILLNQLTMEQILASGNPTVDALIPGNRSK